MKAAAERPGHLAVGDLVVDRDQPPEERGTAVVVRTFDETANQHYVESMDATVAALNQTYPATDPVVAVIFEGHLDRICGTGEWRCMLRDTRGESNPSFWDLLDEYRDEWSVPLRDYAYPASRLAARPYCPECRRRADPVDEGRTYRCPVDSTHAVVDTTGDPLNADDEVPRPEDGWTQDMVTERSMTGDGEAET